MIRDLRILYAFALVTWMSSAHAQLRPPTRATPRSARRLPSSIAGGVAYKLEGAVCESGKPPSDAPAGYPPPPSHVAACATRLVQASAVINFPGVIFFGGALGARSRKFVIAPGVAIGAGASIPIIRPSLTWWLKDGNYLFTLPDTVRFNMNFIGAVTGSLGGLIFPGEATTGGTATEVGYSVGIFGALEFAWTSWDTQLDFDQNDNVTQITGSGQMKTKIAFSLGLLLGYLGNSETVGHAFVIGVQPGATFKF